MTQVGLHFGRPRGVLTAHHRVDLATAQGANTLRQRVPPLVQCPGRGRSAGRVARSSRLRTVPDAHQRSSLLRGRRTPRFRVAALRGSAHYPVGAFLPGHRSPRRSTGRKNGAAQPSWRGPPPHGRQRPEPSATGKSYEAPDRPRGSTSFHAAPGSVRIVRVSRGPGTHRRLHLARTTFRRWSVVGPQMHASSPRWVAAQITITTGQGATRRSLLGPDPSAVRRVRVLRIRQDAVRRDVAVGGHSPTVWEPPSAGVEHAPGGRDHVVCRPVVVRPPLVIEVRRSGPPCPSRITSTCDGW